MRVWVTRSQPGADRQADALARHGHVVLTAPVLTIVEVTGPPPSGAFTDVVFLSEHAVLLGVPRLIDAGIDLTAARIAAIGSSTAARLGDQGIAASVPVVASSEGLLAMRSFAEVAGREILLVSGDGGRDLLENSLTDRGARVEKFAAYKRQAVDAVDQDLADVEAIAVASGDGFEIMARVWFAADGSSDVPVFVPSQRVAAKGPRLGFSRVFTCTGASADA
ncbi:MAG: uroporphyrinogen-III synthase, partial [Gammaproteobacteria bacterium]|nr:uroporphyrinogen-III synthase [Gammaproteobacteria bacterium]